MDLLIFAIFSFLFPILVNRVKRDIVECTSPREPKKPVDHHRLKGFFMHCFQKKSRRGIKTSKRDVALIKRRLRLAQELEANYEREN